MVRSKLKVIFKVFYSHKLKADVVVRADRELKPVASRGRPQKQCEHCRNARKFRSHHAKCDCGEKKGKLLGYANDDLTSGALDTVEHDCCCIHGEQCTCGMTKGADSKAAQHTVKSRPNFSAALSESTLIVVVDGYHKLCHTLNNAALISGTPYQVSRSQTSHDSTTEQATYADPARPQTDSNSVSQHLVDESTLGQNSSNVLGAMTSIPQYSVDSLLPTNQLNTAGTDAFGIGYTDFSYGIPLAAPITTSGLVSSADAQSSEALTAEQWFNLSATPINLNRLDGYSAWPGAEFFANTDSEWRVSPTGPNLSRSAGDLPFDSNKILSDFVWSLPCSGDFN